METYVLIYPTENALAHGARPIRRLEVRGKEEPTEIGTTFWASGPDEPDTEMEIVDIFPENLQEATRALDNCFRFFHPESGAITDYVSDLVAFMERTKKEPVTA